jgi:uncharacterized protein (TIGR02246 family)
MHANTPNEIYELFSEYFNAGTIDLLLTLYTDDAVLIPAAGQEARGKEAIREALNGFLSLKGSFQIEPPTVVEANDTALVMAKWRLNGTSPAGEPVEIAGQTSDVIRCQPEGNWLFVIDNPFGAQSA